MKCEVPWPMPYSRHMGRPRSWGSHADAVTQIYGSFCIIVAYFLLVIFQVSRRWNEVISHNDWLWKRLCVQQGFVTSKPSNITFTEPCVDCRSKPSSGDCSELPKNNMVLHTNNFSASHNDWNSDFQSEDCQRFFNYKQMFLNYSKSFSKFRDGHWLKVLPVCGHTSRITAIDYHNGYLAIGKQCTLSFKLLVHLGPVLPNFNQRL